jgi:2'-phosphotransferase
MSWLLRHGAHKEHIAIDEQGYVNVADMLQWQKMRKELTVAFEEVLEEVRSNDKQRFALLHVPPDAFGTSKPGVEGAKGEDDESIAKETADLNLFPQLRSTDQQDPSKLPALKETKTPLSPSPPPSPSTATSATTNQTSHAISHALSTRNPNPSHYLIRATQGHSLRTLQSTSYLTPLTLTSPSTLPETVVHGTFHAAWDSILRSGGLKPMSRVHVHFATGPSLRSVLDANKASTEATAGAEVESSERGVLSEEKAVISGMRSDAQILIYINIQKALEMGLPFWKSENGVVLSEGIVMEEGSGKGVKDRRPKVPMQCWDVVVEVKEGLGAIWRDGDVVKEVPQHLKSAGWPHRKGKREKLGGASPRTGGNEGGKSHGGGSRKKSGGSKPKLFVERDDDLS